MKTTFDIESILFQILNNSDVKSEITGGIYFAGDRPIDSEKEDIVINTITLTQDFLPQLGNSNVNIYVKDMIVKIENRNQTKANRVRLKELADEVIDVLRYSIVKGLTITVTHQTLMRDMDINQHFINLRLSWNIQTN